MRYVVLLCLAFSVLRLFPIMQYGDAAFGYDTGIYRRIVREYSTATETKPAFAFGSVATFFHQIGFSDDAILIGLYVGVQTALAALMFFFVRSISGQKEALLALFLFTFSPVQYEFYWWYYYRQMIALVLLVLIWWCVEKKRLFWTVPALIIMGSLHPPSALLVGCVMIVCAFSDKERRKSYLCVLVVSSVATLVLNWQELSKYFFVFTSQYGLALGNGAQELSGQFISVGKYIVLSLLYLPLGVWGFVRYRKEHTVLSVTCIMSVLFLVLHVVLYRRVLVVLDLLVIVYAAKVLVKEIPAFVTSPVRKMLMGLYGLCVIVYGVNTVAHKVPLIYPAELLAVQDLKQLPADAVVFTVSSASAPWVYGFATQPVVAPGMFEYNLWNEGEWRMFWHTQSPEERSNLLSRYEQRPLYFFLNSWDQWVESGWRSDTRFVELRTGLWKYE